MRIIILASSSATRKILMKRLGIPFQIVASDYEENMKLPHSPLKLARVLSRGKAEAVARHRKNAIVIGADSIFLFKGRILGKPHSPSAAKKMLRMISNGHGTAITGLTIIDTRTGKQISKAVKTEVFFRALSREEIDAYVKTGEPLDKAGAFAILERGALFIRKIEGDYTNVSGLPLPTLVVELRKFGVKV